MTKLISGKDALIALANGEDVEYTNSTTPSWHDLSKSKISISELIDGRFNDFRLKPRTISINGIEVPAPFEPTQDMLDKFPEVHYQDTYAGQCSLSVEDEIIKLGYKNMIGETE